MQNNKQQRDVEADFLTSRQIHDDEVYKCRLQRTQRPEKGREGQGALTRSRCVVDEIVVTTRVPTGGRPDTTPATNSFWC
jgi:hypothetical protein